MAGTTTQEAIIYLMVMTSAVDRDMTDVELQRIGHVVTAWPVFADFEPARLVQVARDCQQLLAGQGGVEDVFARVAGAIPPRLADTAYAAVVEVATADHEVRVEEHAMVELVRERLSLDAAVAHAIERAAKARSRSPN